MAGYVYRLLDDEGGLLYIGSSGDPMGRLRTHRRKPWGDDIASIEIDIHPNSAAALIAEREQIESLNPPHNVLLNRQRELPGRRQAQVLEALREIGPCSEVEIKSYLRERGEGLVDSFVGMSLLRLAAAGVIRVAGNRPARGGRWKTARIYEAAA